jgi:hypothetical protein
MRKCVGEAAKADQPLYFTKPVKHSHDFGLFAVLAHLTITDLATRVLETLVLPSPSSQVSRMNV